eukprot:496108-Prymnesium_polylepis.1
MCKEKKNQNEASRKDQGHRLASRKVSSPHLPLCISSSSTSRLTRNTGHRPRSPPNTCTRGGETAHEENASTK